LLVQPISAHVAEDDAHSVAEDAVVLWAVFNVLDGVPATPEAQSTFAEARRRLEEKLRDVGIHPEQIECALDAARIPRFEARGDPTA
jgi:hypothetical protein